MARGRSGRSGAGSGGCAGCFLGFLLKFLAFLQAFAAVSAVLYGAWIVSRWARHHELHLDHLLPDLWYTPPLPYLLTAGRTLSPALIRLRTRVQVRVRRHGGRPPLLRHPPRRVRRRRDQQRVLPLLRTSTFLCFHHLFLSYLLNAYASSSFHHSPLMIPIPVHRLGHGDAAARGFRGRPPPPQRALDAGGQNNKTWIGFS
jgi:hypothetical protein